MVLSLRGKVNTERERERENYRDDVGKNFMFVPHLKKPVLFLLNNNKKEESNGEDIGSLFEGDFQLKCNS